MKINQIIIIVAVAFVTAAAHAASVSIISVSRDVTASTGDHLGSEFTSTDTGAFQHSVQDVTVTPTDTYTAFATQDSTVSLTENVLSIHGRTKCNDPQAHCGDGQSFMTVNFIIDAPCNFFLSVDASIDYGAQAYGTVDLIRYVGGADVSYFFGESVSHNGFPKSTNMSGVLPAGSYQLDARAFGDGCPGSGAHTFVSLLVSPADAPLPTPASPSISATSAGIVVSWPASSPALVLESASNITNPITWTTVTNAVGIVGESFSVSLPIATDSQYFRLKRTQP